MKKFVLAIATVIASLSFSIPAFAAGWVQNSTGWWYDNGNGTWPAEQWCWIDGNNDGTAECYYFNRYGYCMINTVTPDGYTVNDSGAWTDHGVVQTKNVGSGSQNSSEQSIIGTYSGYYTANQGKTGVTITIFDDLNETWANVHFYNLAGMSNAKEGTFLSKVNKISDNEYEIKQDSWIDQPSGYSMLSWDVTYDGSMLTGTATSNSSFIIRCQKES